VAARNPPTPVPYVVNVTAQANVDSCLGILRLGKTYTPARLEAACQRALAAQACSYRSLQSILQQGLDQQTTLPAESERTGPQHKNLRGATYYDSSSKLVH